MWSHLVLMACEVAHAPRKLHDYSFTKHVDFKDRKRFLECLFQPRPVVLVTGHFGNFELAGYFSALFGQSLSLGDMYQMRAYVDGCLDVAQQDTDAPAPTALARPDRM